MSERPRLADIHVTWNGGPYCIHNYPCPVCGLEHAVRKVAVGIFMPCEDCQRAGWLITNETTRLRQRVIEDAAFVLFVVTPVLLWAAVDLTLRWC